MKIYFSELLQKNCSSRLTKNFHRLLKLKKSNDDCQQDLYKAVIGKREDEDEDYSMTFTLTDNTEVTLHPGPLLSCVSASKIPIRNIKTIKKATLAEVTTSDWNVVKILTREGAVIEELKCYSAAYSPVIQEMIHQGKIKKLR